MVFLSSKIRYWPLLLTALQAVIYSSCNQGLGDYCSEKPHALYQSGIAELTPWKNATPYAVKGGKQGRALASYQPDAKSLPEDERDHWLAWSLEQLQQVQGALDWLNEHRETVKQERAARAGLSQAADLFVALHGYAEQGKVDRMMATLDGLDALHAKESALVCERN